ncbi:hypothetical protein NE237_016415 [Protea cynaroides]|uniref:Uncharacterized protein n=1 Tax=Protea cynaroides TaxID=273540 RepID=A0A9Q0HDG2_9MAGN|nr:hypothetical protein NE237_016415 [Protea cynaroides]
MALSLYILEILRIKIHSTGRQRTISKLFSLLQRILYSLQKILLLHARLLLPDGALLANKHFSQRILIDHRDSMAGFRWSSSSFRWLDFDFSISSLIFRWPGWPGIDLSYFIPRWAPRNFQWPDLDSVVDDVMWNLLTIFESLALAAMLCFFFVCCGCTF